MSPTLETTSPACHRFSRRCPTAAVFDEFSERLQIVLFTIRDPLNALYSGIADVRHVPRELEVMPREWESLNAKAEEVCIATDTVSRQ